MKNSPSKSVLPIAIMGGILAVSTASIFTRFAQVYTSSIVIAAMRLTFASLILAPIALTRHRTEIRSVKRGDLLLGVFSGIFLALHFASWISSLEYTSVASSVVLVTTTPLWVALLSPLVLKEPISRLVVMGMVLALLGGILIGLADACRWQNGFSCSTMADYFQGQAFWGNFLALAGAWMAAGYLLIGRRLRAKLSLVPYIFIVYGISAGVLLALMVLSGQSALHLPAAAYVWMLLLAIIPQLLGHSTFNWALKYLPASMVAITLLGEPIGSTILAFIILDETPSSAELVGAVLILAGIYLASRIEPRKDIEETIVTNE